MNLRRIISRRRAPNGLLIAASAGLGVGAMYLLDPDRGTRRRAVLRDKSVHALHQVADLIDKSMRDLEFRARGLASETRALFNAERVPDEVLVQRVRSRMGRAVSHPHAVCVSAENGRVTLTGVILVGDVKPLLSVVARVPGVREIDDQLEVHSLGDPIPALQGGYRPRNERAVLMRERWAPITRVVMGALGGTILAYGLTRRDQAGLALAGAGTALLVRDIANRPIKRLLGVTGNNAIELQKTITVHAPVEEVFSLFCNPENLPRFMSHLSEVTKIGDGRYHWVAAGPGGVPVSWDGEITQLVPNEVLAWRSLPSALIRNEGVARFERTPKGDTRVDIHMSYNPPAGAIGHLVASLFGADPKHALDEDMVRLQSLLERGKTTAHGTVVRASDLKN